MAKTVFIESDGTDASAKNGFSMAWGDGVGVREDMKGAMLKVADNVLASNRRSCQIKITDALDGLLAELLLRGVLSGVAPGLSSSSR